MAIDNPTPLVTVVVPTRNRCESLRRCVEALLASQVRTIHLDICVVDDGSRDGTAEMLESLCAMPRTGPVQLRYLRHPEARGAAAARNTGVASSDAEWILFTDDDCEPHPDWAEALGGRQRDPQVGAVAGRTRSPEGGNWVARYCRRMGYNEFPKKGRMRRVLHFTNTANCAYRRSAFQKVGGFDLVLSQVGYEDVDLSWRVVLLGYKLEYDPEPLVIHHHREDVRSLCQAFRKRGHSAVVLGHLWRYTRADRQSLLYALRHQFVAALSVFGVPAQGCKIAREGVPIREALRFAWLAWLCNTSRAVGATTMRWRILRGRQDLDRKSLVPPHHGNPYRALRAARKKHAPRRADGPPPELAAWHEEDAFALDL